MTRTKMPVPTKTSNLKFVHSGSSSNNIITSIKHSSDDLTIIIKPVIYTNQTESHRQYSQNTNFRKSNTNGKQMTVPSITSTITSTIGKQKIKPKSEQPNSQIPNIHKSYNKPKPMIIPQMSNLFKCKFNNSTSSDNETNSNNPVPTTK